jgi:hypothetical protein
MVKAKAKFVVVAASNQYAGFGAAIAYFFAKEIGLK